MKQSEVHLRQWQDGDLDRFAEMNADPEVMRWFLKCPSAEESTAMIERLGFTWDPAEDFPHPLVPADHPLVRHVLYRKAG